MGRRVREARIAAGLSQSQLASLLRIDRSALVRVESGQRQVSALELFRLSDHLGVPAGHFVSAPIPAIVSQRMDLDEAAQPAARDRFRLDAALEAHARDAEFLRTGGFLPDGLALPSGPVASVADARALALSARAAIALDDKPVQGMASTAEYFGLYLLVAALPGEGASLRLDDQFGVAIVGGTAPAGRRRFTAAHELGHHLLGDEYQSDIGVAASRDERECLIDAFAAAFLLPETAVTARWPLLQGSEREKLVQLAAEFRVSWGAAVKAVKRAGLVDAQRAGTLNAQTPQRGDFLAIFGTEPVEDLRTGETGAAWRRAVLAAYQDGTVTPARAIELLHGALEETDLPDREDDAAP
ncbi:helix-turn-helix domain-containing protein [Jiangella anatolica]|uniref:helix-turn-helix domain-containing protein n=1 Tax=Jiangella anatolica TaxID=2670374 RepID=UPI0018F38E85|nr:XRE family transcriptional regulator [Jiangella anatolica]